MAEENKVVELEIDEHPAKKKHWSARSRNRAMGIFGAFIILFACIGVVWTVSFATKSIIGLANNQKEKEYFEQFIYPLVILDPPPFDSISSLDQKTILTAGVWNFIINADKSNYVVDEYGTISVPQVDIEVYCNQLFGSGITCQHQALGDTEYSFSYNQEGESYDIPTSLVYISYLPRVTQIVREEDQVTLTVEYISPNVTWNYNVFNGKDVSMQPDKRMEYVLEPTEDGGYKIVSVSSMSQGGESGESSGSASSSESANSESSESSVQADADELSNAEATSDSSSEEQVSE